MQCDSCGSKWESKNTVTVCPFCGCNLKQTETYDDIESVLNIIFEKFGFEIINDPRKFMAILSDYAPELVNEQRLIKIAVDSGAYKDILGSKNKSANEQCAAYLKAKAMLEQQYFLNSDWAEKVLLWYSCHLNINTKLNNEDVQKTTTVISSQKRTNPVVALSTKIHEKPQINISHVLSNKSKEPEMKRADLYSQNKYFRNFCASKQAFLQGIIAGGECYSVGIKSDKTVLSTKHNVKDFSNIVMISAGRKYIAGVQKNGQVYVTGKDASGFVKGFRNIKKVAVGHSHIVGLQQDGKVVAVNNNLWGQCEVDSWNSITDISASTSYTLGLKRNGTVVIAGNDNPEISMGIKNWNNIIAISAGGQHAMGLKRDGTVVSAGSNKEIRCDVGDWKNIIAISAGNRHYVGLKSDGTVIATGINDCGQCDVEEWEDIIAVAAGMLHTIGLKADGTILLAGDSGWLSHSKIKKWKLFNNTDELENLYESLKG